MHLVLQSASLMSRRSYPYPFDIAKHLGVKIMRRERLPFSIRGCRRESFEEMPQISIWLQVVGLGRLDQAVDGRAGYGPSGMSGKQPVLPAHGEGPDGVLRQAVVRPEPAVLQVDQKPFLLI